SSPARKTSASPFALAYGESLRKRPITANSFAPWRHRSQRKIWLLRSFNRVEQICQRSQSRWSREGEGRTTLTANASRYVRARGTPVPLRGSAFSRDHCELFEPALAFSIDYDIRLILR